MGIASIFGWMNLFARGLGGALSDKMNAKMGMRGRLWAQTILLFCEGALVLVFANTGTLGASITGIVGAGGNSGAVGFGMGFRQLDYEAAFTIMGITIMASSALSVLISIKGHAGLLWGQDDPNLTKGGETLAVPEPDAEKAEE